ncbi:MAG TPA: PAS domain S-box protein, partial [Candidatus Bathyarchaeia archaeon]|nr:PAS domain S-box protein [Candidatus Bathyarchaeia archaeon]
MSSSSEELGSGPDNREGALDSREDGAQPAREIAEMSLPSVAGSPFVYRDVCRDKTDEERQLAAVMEIANVINSRLNLEQILSAISKEFSKVIEYDIGCVAIYDKEQNGLFIRHVWRKSGDKSGEGRYVPLDESNLIGWVAIHRKPVMRGDIPADTRFREIMKEDALKSDIVVPLMAKNELVGTVNVGSYGVNHFTDFDVDLIVRFSNLTSIAIEKCQLVRELEELGGKYHLLMRNASEIILIINASGEIVECNKAMCDLTGYTADEIVGREVMSLTLPERREETKKRVSNILRGEAAKLSEIPYLRKNGAVMYLEISANIMRIKDHPYILLLAHDVTERKALQEQITLQNAELLAINKKLRELDDLKNEFLGRISHELRTPLSVIMAYTGTLLEDRDQTIDSETRNEFLHVIEGHSNKLLGLINDLLDLSRVEVSETMLHVDEASLNDVIKISTKIVEPSATQSRVTLVLDLDEGIPIISFDPLRIRQACVNLLTNAVKFSREGDSVVIASRIVADEVVVSVRDHGPGISPNDIPELF